MRCKACDTDLNNYESTLRCSNTGDFVDLCMSCLRESEDTNFNDRDDLRSLADVEDSSIVE